MERRISYFSRYPLFRRAQPYLIPLVGMLIGVPGGIYAANQLEDITDDALGRNRDIPEVIYNQDATKEVGEMTAVAVSQVGGVVPVEVKRTDAMRFAPDCHLTYTVKYPFTAESVVNLQDLEISQTGSDPAGNTLLTVKVNNNVEATTARTDPSQIEPELDQGFGTCWRDAPIKEMLNRSQNVAGMRQQIEAKCLASRLDDPAVRQVMTEGLREQILVFYPSVKESQNVTVEWNIEGTRAKIQEEVDELNAEIERTNTDDFKVQIPAVDACSMDPSKIEVRVNQAVGK